MVLNSSDDWRKRKGTVVTMNKKISHISQEIRKGKFLEENIPQLFNYLADSYDTYAGIRLAMHYYTFYESFCDEENTWSSDARAAISQLNEIIRENILQMQSGTGRENALRAVDELRNNITEKMDVLIAYTDLFQIYEYVLNRLEFRFNDELEPVDETEFAKEILRYIFDTEDNFVINEKIKDIIGQLPIRITRQKYFDLLEEGIRTYLGADQASLDTFLYMLRTSAMLYQQESMDSVYPRLKEMKEALSGVDFKAITREAYDKAVVTLRAATLVLEEESTIYFGLQEMVNDVYTMLLCFPYAGMSDLPASKARNAAFSVIGEINRLFCVNEKSELQTDCMGLFTDMEGVQEELSYEQLELEAALYEADKEHHSLIQSLMLEPLIKVLVSSQKLLSNSLFTKLEEDEKSAIVTQDLIETETGKLKEELANLFAKQDKFIIRAVMANTINKIPVFFNDHKEVMDYVRYSLERCSDPYEKAACIEIIKMIMSK